MYSEGVPEFVIDQGLYYPTATNYGYFCTGFDSPGNWDDHQRVFGLDGQEIYAGAQSESFPYVYYTPSYGYAQSPYNPYTPGAVVGVDNSYMGTQQYYTIPSYENPESTQSYFPMVVQSESDIVANSKTPFLDSSFSTTNLAESHGLKHNFSSLSPMFIPTSLGPSSSQTNSFMRSSDGIKSVPGSSKHPAPHGVPSDSFSNPSSKGKVAQALGSVSHGKAPSNHAQLRVVSLPSDHGLSNFRPIGHDGASVDKFQPRFLHGRVPSDVKVSPDASTGQNLVPRINKLKNPLVVKAYTTRAGDVDSHGNITICRDQYNKDGFLTDFVNAKFFVIKSYSEDDVHKSIKYNVWSSTPNGNKKLNNAYEDAQRMAAGNSKGCPIFLFFSVNASGQFCGVAEMLGHVDFHKDMDFWQQDKWSGSFPVKWHIVKDVPNSNFRHIILENNENKPVTNSRDTQEIHYKKGMEMLKIFKNFASRTSLFDDFLFYESREKIMQEDRAKILIRSYESPFLVPVLDPPRKLNSIFDMPSSGGEKIYKHADTKMPGSSLGAVTEEVIVSTINKSAASESEKPVGDEKMTSKSGSSVAAVSAKQLTIASDGGSERSVTDDKISKNGDPKKSGSGVMPVAAEQAPVVSKTNKTVASESEKSVADEKISNHCDPKKPVSDVFAVPAEQVSVVPKINKTSADEGEKIVSGRGTGIDSVLKIGSLTINAKQPKSEPKESVSTTVSNQSVDVVTVGSMPIKVSAYAEPSGFLTVGSIQLDPRSLRCNESSSSGKSTSRKV
nr:YTH domain-containing protein ECT4 isoform X1 [Ipomoea batatas]